MSSFSSSYEAGARGASARRARRRLHQSLVGGQRSSAIGITLIGAVLLASAIGHFLLPSPTTLNLEATLAAPSVHHLFGTDDLGRDVLSRTLAATWLDLGIAFSATYAGVAIG